MLHLNISSNQEALFGGVCSYLWYQINIPMEASMMLEINPVVGSLWHALISLVLPLGSFVLINVYKELLKDKCSWVSKAQESIVKAFSFKWFVKLFKPKM